MINIKCKERRNIYEFIFLLKGSNIDIITF